MQIYLYWIFFCMCVYVLLSYFHINSLIQSFLLYPRDDEMLFKF